MEEKITVESKFAEVLKEMVDNSKKLDSPHKHIIGAISTIFNRSIIKETEYICVWTDEDGEGDYETDCGQLFTIMNGTPKDNNMIYCHFCGKKIAEPPKNINDGT